MYIVDNNMYKEYAIYDACNDKFTESVLDISTRSWFPMHAIGIMISC